MSPGTAYPLRQRILWVGVSQRPVPGCQAKQAGESTRLRVRHRAATSLHNRRQPEAICSQCERLNALCLKGMWCWDKATVITWAPLGQCVVDTLSLQLTKQPHSLTSTHDILNLTAASWTITNYYPLANKHSYWKLPIIVDLPITIGDFPIVMFVYQRVSVSEPVIWKTGELDVASIC